MLRKVLAAGVVFGLTVTANLAVAQSYPDKSVRLVVPYPPGGGVDVPFRFIAQLTSQMWGKPMVVENRPGANTFIAMDNVTKSPADGYSLVTIDQTSMSLNPALYAKLPYDPEKDLVPAAVLIQFSCMLVTSPDLPANTLKEFIAMAKAKPDQLRYGSSGIGSAQHLIIEEFMARAGGLKMQHVPFKGVADTLQALMGSQIEAGSSAYVAANALIKAGKVKALGIGSDKRLPLLPDVPTFKESGVDYTCPGWMGVSAPAGTPRPILDKIAADMGRAVTSKEFTDKFVNTLGIEVVNLTGPRALEFVHADRAMTIAAVKRLNIPTINP